MGPSTQLPKDIIPHAFCVKHIGLIENALFVDFYKSHIMLQALTHNRTHKKHDSIVALLCTLFFKYPRFNEEVLVFQSIARKRYIIVAEYILKECTSVNETDYFLGMKLARILIKKELQLSLENLHMSAKHRELMNLAALNYAAKRYKSALKYIKLLSNRIDGKSNFEQKIKVDRYFFVIDEFACVYGLFSLVEYNYLCGGRIKNWNDNGKTTSVNFFRKWMIVACQAKLGNSRQYEDLAVELELELTTATELCLCALLNYKIQPAQNEDTHTMNDLTPTTGPQLVRESDIIQVSQRDNFPDLLRKCAVIHLTKFYQSLRMKFKDVKCTKAASHYEALHWYSQQRYDLVLKLCNDVLQEEKCASGIVSAFGQEDPLLQYRMMPNCLFPFQELYDSDVTSVLGLTFLIN